MTKVSYFRDRDRAPSPDSIAEALGPKLALVWDKLLDRMKELHPDIEVGWAYYADAKGWLMKVRRKSKTMFWGSIERQHIRVAFYFPERLREEVLSSHLSETRKKQLRATKPVGKLCAVPLRVTSDLVIRDVMALIELKKSLK